MSKKGTSTNKMSDTTSNESEMNLWRQTVKVYRNGNVQAVMSVLKMCKEGEIEKNFTYLVEILDTAISSGHVEIVKFLVQELQVSIGYYDLVNRRLGCRTTLKTAVLFNNMVQDLIEMGADANAFLGVSPLSEACRSSDISVVRLLLDAGANVNLPDFWGFTPLIYACCMPYDRQHREIVTCLLDRGANCNWKNKAGQTALHKAVLNNEPGLVELLLQHQAKILQDEFGFTPVFLAINWDEIFYLFQRSQFVDKTDKVNALEYKAASLAPDDMDGVYQLLHQAMRTRYEGNSIVLEKPVREPVAAFGNVCESQTLQELEARKGMTHVLMMECLAVEDRLLGRGNICFSANFDRIWRKLLDAGLYSGAMSLAEYGIDFFPLENADTMLRYVLQLASTTSIIEKKMQCAIKMLGRSLKKEEGIELGSFSIAQSCVELLHTCIELDATPDKLKARIQAECLIALFRTGHYNYPLPLYAATRIMLQETTGSDFSLYMTLVTFLVECGADINEKNHEGDTILAQVLGSDLSENDQKKLVQFLLTEGASPAYLGKDASFPCDFTNDDGILQLLLPYYPLSLKHLAAFVIVNSGIQYKDLVPEMVANFIDGHK